MEIKVGTEYFIFVEDKKGKAIAMYEWDKECNLYIPYCTVTMDFGLVNKGYAYFDLPTEVEEYLLKENLLIPSGHNVLYRGKRYTLMKMSSEFMDGLAELPAA